MADEPVLVAEEPVVVAEEPVLVAEEPVLVAEEPVLVAEERVVVAQGVAVGSALGSAAMSLTADGLPGMASADTSARGPEPAVTIAGHRAP